MSNDTWQARHDALRTVQAWQDASNAQDIEQLLRLSDENIEIVGPRGVASGHQMLRDWMARAGLTLETQRTFARENSVVLVQHGVWRDADTGDIKGEADLASSFRVAQGRVIRYARFDDVASALADVDLTEGNEVEVK